MEEAAPNWEGERHALLSQRISDIGLEIRGTLHDIHIPIDILVTTPEDFAWRKDYVGTIEWPAAREGKVLYART